MCQEKGPTRRFFSISVGFGSDIEKKSRVGSDRVEMLKYLIGYSQVPHFSRVFPGMLSMSGIKGKLDISG